MMMICKSEILMVLVAGRLVLPSCQGSRQAMHQFKEETTAHRYCRSKRERGGREKINAGVLTTAREEDTERGLVLNVYVLQADHYV